MGGFDSGTFDIGTGTNPNRSDGGGNSVTDAATGKLDASDAALLFTIDAGPDCHPVVNDETLSAEAVGLPSSGLALWLRADHGIYGATTGGGNPAVCAWQDLSGGTTVLAGASRPSLIANGIGTQAAVQFSAAEQVLTTGGVLGIASTSPRTMIAVERLTSANGRFNPVMQGQGASLGAYVAIDANTWQTQGNLEGVYITNNSYDTGTATTTAGARIHVLTVESTMTVGTALPGTIDYRINGAAQTLSLRQGSGNFEDFSGANFTAVGLFGTASMGGTTTGALVSEVLVYGRALTLVEKQMVEAVLKARYAIP